MPPRSGSARLTSTLAAVLCPALLASACSGIDLRPTDAARSPSPSVSPSDAHVDLSRLPVPRAQFCDVLAKKDVTAALDGPETGTAHYGNGDEFEVRPGYRDVSHEYGCVFEGPGGRVAKAWVFARRVGTGEARMLVRRERGRRGCAFPHPLRFGTPSLAAVCRVAGADSSGPGVRARLEGLFRDSWLACEVSEPQEKQSRVEVLRRAEDWCTAVVTTIGARP